MASIRKRGSQWEVRIRRKGFPTLCKSFATKLVAERWAREIEADMERQIFRDTSLAEEMTVAQMLARFEKEVLSHRKWGRAEAGRLPNINRLLGGYALINVTPERVAWFRDSRLRIPIPEGADQETVARIEERNRKEKRVGPASVTREMNILSTVFKLAISEWGVYLPQGNPVSVVKRPRKPRGRDRRVTDAELARLAEYSDSEWLIDVCQFAVETAMRRGEIAAMQWKDVDFSGRRIHIPETKTGKPRTIPMTRVAMEILMRRHGSREGKVWNVRADSITQAFIRARDRAGLTDLRFHDLRHEATSRFFEMGLDHMKVAKITGHEDWRCLQRYTHLKPDSLADEIDAAKARMGITSSSISPDFLGYGQCETL